MSMILDILKNMPAYAIGLVHDHMILMVVLAAFFIFVTFFSNQVANKLRSVFILASLLIIVFSFISQKWTRIGFIILGLIAMAVIRLIGFIISEIRITRKNKRIAERALEKAAKRRGSWQNKQGYSGARKLIVEPEYVPGKMNREEIEDIIKNEFADKKPEEVTEEASGETFEEIAEEGSDTSVPAADIADPEETEIPAEEALSQEVPAEEPSAEKTPIEKTLTEETEQTETTEQLKED